MSLVFCFKVQGSVKRHGVKVKTVDLGGVLSGSRFSRLSEPMGPRVSVPFSPILALGPPAASPGCLILCPSWAWWPSSGAAERSAVSHGVERYHPSRRPAGCVEVISITNWL